MPPLSSLDPATLMKPDSGRLLSFADRLRESGDEDLSHLVRRAADGLVPVRRFPSPRGPVGEGPRWG